MSLSPQEAAAARCQWHGTGSGRLAATLEFGLRTDFRSQAPPLLFRLFLSMLRSWKVRISAVPEHCQIHRQLS